MSTQRITLEALSVAAFATALTQLDHETRAVVTATENGRPWAHVQISPMTDTIRSAFPVDEFGVRGDTSKRGQSGVMVSTPDTQRALHVVIGRAVRMAQ